MKKLLLLAVFSIVYVFGFGQKPVEYIIEMGFENRTEIEKITKLVSISNVQDATIVAYASPFQLLRLDKLGYDYKILPKPDHTGKVINMATTVEQMASWDRYPTYGVYLEMMQNFATDYPNICRLDTIGFSVDGRLLLAVKISDNVNVDEAEPEVFYTATMHGDETTGFVLHLRLIDYLLSNYGSDEEVDSMVDNIAIWINPAANPDGTYNGGDNTVNGSTRSNANGIDLNRNFPDPKGGDHPDGNSWQIETIAMMNFAEAHSFVLSQNTHGGIEVVNYPWDTWSRRHPDDAWWIRVSRDYADLAQANSPSGYMTARNNGITNGYDWYPVEGGRQDYMNYVHHCREFVLEISNTKLLSTDLLPAHWTYNKQSLLNYIKEAMYGINGVVTNTNNEPLAAEIHILDHDADNSHVVTDPDSGDYYRPIEAGTYTVQVSAYGYLSQTFENIVAVDGQATELNVVLSSNQTVNITGTITDAITGLAIEGATISFVDAPIDAVVTDPSGAYSVSSIIEDNYAVRVSANGYATIFETLAVSVGNTSFDFSMSPINAISFEDGVLPDGFATSGNVGWSVVQGVSFDGAYSAQSGDISDGQSSLLEFTFEFDIATDIVFYVKVSSENNYDKLKFYIDGVEMSQWSGIIDWTEVSFPVIAGERTFKWEYVKDGSAFGGEDAAWIDFIVLPLQETTEPMASFSASSLNFTLDPDNTESSDSIMITNIGQGVLQYTTLMNTGTWAEIVSDEVSLAHDESAYIKVQVSLGELVDGIYTDQLLIVADASYTIPVTMNVTGVSVNDALKSSMRVYPNPSYGVLNIISESIVKQVTVFNVSGMTVLTVNGDGTSQLQINSSLKSGLYFVSVKTCAGVELRKIVIE